MKVTLIPIVIGALKIIPQSLKELEIREQVENNQSTTLLRPARILKRVQETCCHSDFSERLLVNAGGKNSH